VRPWWHADSRVISQQRDKPIKVGILPGADIAVEQRPLLIVWHWQGWRHVGLARRELLPKCGPSALERAIGRCDRRIEQNGRLGGRPAEHVAQQQHNPLSRREQLDCRDKRELYGLVQLITRIWA
jgi:hypothetical protein